jgi:hypothetical protein
VIAIPAITGFASRATGESNWYDVPDDAIINEPNRDGRTIVWPMHIWEGEKLTIAIRCFMPGSMM